MATRRASITRAALRLLSLLAIALSGCGDPTHPEALVGSWKVDPTQASMPRQILQQPPEHRKQFKDVMVPSMILTLSAEGKAEMFNSPGSWTADERVLRINSGDTATGHASAADEHDFNYTLEEGGKALRTVSNGVELVWRKQ